MRRSSIICFLICVTFVFLLIATPVTMVSWYDSPESAPLPYLFFWLNISQEGESRYYALFDLWLYAEGNEATKCSEREEKEFKLLYPGRLFTANEIYLGRKDGINNDINTDINTDPWDSFNKGKESQNLLLFMTYTCFLFSSGEIVAQFDMGTHFPAYGMYKRNKDSTLEEIYFEKRSKNSGAKKCSSRGGPCE